MDRYDFEVYLDSGWMETEFRGRWYKMVRTNPTHYNKRGEYRIPVKFGGGIIATVEKEDLDDPEFDQNFRVVKV